MEIKSGFCQCGCGQQTAISPRNDATLGYVKGQPFRFVPSHSQRVTRRADVYRRRRVAGSRHGSVLEHIAVVETSLGHPLQAGVQVHHVDGNRRNNANRNLVVCQDQSYHALLHTRADVVRAGGDPNTQKFCRRCQASHPFSEFNRGQSQCRRCQSEYFKQWLVRKKVAA